MIFGGSRRRICGCLQSCSFCFTVGSHMFFPQNKILSIFLEGGSCFLVTSVMGLGACLFPPPHHSQGRQLRYVLCVKQRLRASLGVSLLLNAVPRENCYQQTFRSPTASLLGWYGLDTASGSCQFGPCGPLSSSLHQEPL